jgi:Tfp pilus assembly protein PilF/TolB-like protein
VTTTLRILTGAVLATLAWSVGAHAETTPRAIVVVPFDASGLAPEEQWMGEGVAQLISLGLAWHPSLVQIDRSRVRDVQDPAIWTGPLVSQAAAAVHAHAGLYGRIERQGADLVIQPHLVDLQGGGIKVSALAPLTMADADLLARAAPLASLYARELGVPLTAGDLARLDRGARATSSLEAFKRFTEGQVAFATGATEVAVDRMLGAVEADPKFGMAQYMLGVVHMALRNRWKAAAQFRAAVQIDPGMPEPFKMFGDLFLAAPRRLFDEAIEAYSKAIELRPFYADAQVGLGDARKAKGDVAGAVTAYRAAAAANPFSARAHARLAGIYAETGRCADSATAQGRALDLDPRSGPAPACVPTSP